MENEFSLAWQQKKRRNGQAGIQTTIILSQLVCILVTVSGSAHLARLKKGQKSEQDLYTVFHHYIP